MRRCLVLTAIIVVSTVSGPIAIGQRADLLGSVEHLDTVNVNASVTQYEGKSAINLTGARQQGAPDIRGARPPRQADARPGQRETPRAQPSGPRTTGAARAGTGDRPRRSRPESIAIVKGTDFTNGTIEVELAGRPNKSAGPNARGFIGIAFHVEKADPISYDCFYLRPTNGRADDQLRRTHSCQYMSHPDHPFYVLRRESPGLYESYVDLVPGQWTNVKIEVDGQKAMLYVHGSDQPCLVVNDLKRAGESGAIALWMEQSTDAYFRNLVVTDK